MFTMKCLNISPTYFSIAMKLLLSPSWATLARTERNSLLMLFAFSMRTENFRRPTGVGARLMC